MRKIYTVLSALTLLLSGVIAGGANASATTNMAVANCNGHSVVSASYVRRFSDNKALGAIQLCRNGNHWFSMFIYYGDQLPSGHIGNARKWFVRNWEILGQQSCADSGGSGYAAGSTTWCTSPQDYPAGDPTQQRRGEGELLQYVNGKWVEYARGYTLLCNYNGCQ